ncbi:MAG TPA: HEAT repeat domain-containing protein [Planctomycetota bacterium]
MAIPRACILHLAVGIALAGLGPAQSPAPGPDAEAVEFVALLKRLVPPLKQAVVQAAVHHPHVADMAAAQGLITHLTAHRGVVAVQGILGLASHDSPEVRTEALRAIATLALRVDGAADGARMALRDISDEVRLAAIATLGVVGEARDIPDLLELLSSEDKAPQVTAFRALRMLTRLRLANDVRAWTYWWKQTNQELGKSLDAAIQRLTDGGSEADLVDARNLLNQSTWFAPQKLEEAAREWLRSSARRLRSEAFRLVATARLGDLADDVAHALQLEVDPDAVRNGVECTAVLGISVDRMAELQPSTRDPARVQAAVREAQVADSKAAQALITHLITQGGVVAVQGVLVLASHDCPEVRAAALRAVALLGLRVAGAAEGARRALDDSSDEVKLAAIHTLGVVGEARDISELLELLSSEDNERRVAAVGALQALTGLKLADDAQAWTDWWKTASELGKRFDRAIQVLTDGAGPQDLVDARNLLHQSAWLNPRKLEDAARKWLRSAEPRQRGEAFQLVAGARLANLADDVAKALKHEVEPDVVQNGIECAVALCISVDRTAAQSAQPPR